MSAVSANALSRLEVKLLSTRAMLPSRGSPFSAGLDLHSAQEQDVLVIPPHGGRMCIATDLSIACPPNTYGRIAPRSGLALKHGIDVGAGVIDADYRGPVGVVLFNFGTNEFEVRRGDRIAQLILEQVIIPDEVVVVEELSETQRGEGGFGSTGVSAVATKKQRTVSPVTNAETANADADAPTTTSNGHQDPPEASVKKDPPTTDSD